MDNPMRDIAAVMLDAAYIASGGDSGLILTNSVLEFVEDNLDYSNVEENQVIYLKECRERYDQILRLDMDSASEHTRALADLDRARERAQEATSKTIEANSKLQMLLANRERDIKRVELDLEQAKKYNMDSERQKSQFAYLSGDGLRMYFLAALLVVTFIFTESQAVLAVMSALISAIGQGYMTGVGSAFSKREKRDGDDEQS